MNDTILLRFIAICLVLNSHLDHFYPVASLATGGAIGNALFFMLSSFGLLLSEKKSPKPYSTYLKKRFKRIYPPLWALLILLVLPIQVYHHCIDFKGVLPFLIKFIYPTFWFIRALILYYILGWFLIKKYNPKKYFITMAVLLVAYFFIYWNFLDVSAFTIESGSFKMVPYAMIFLFGIYLAIHNTKIIYSGWTDIFFFIVALASLYIHKYLMAHHLLITLQFFQQFILFVIVFYLLKICRSAFLKDRLMNMPFIGGAIKYISGITLEIYITHMILSPYMLHYHFSFPLNIVVFLPVCVMIAAALNMLVTKTLNFTSKFSQKGFNSPKNPDLVGGI